MKNLTIYEQEYLNEMDLYLHQFLYYINLSMIPIGTFLNLLSILVFMKDKFRKTCIGNLHTAITISDISLLVVIFIHMFSLSIRMDIQLKSDLSCKLIHYYIRIASQLSIWTRVLLTIDILATTKSPKRRYGVFRKKKSLFSALICLILFFHLICLPNFWLYLKKNHTFVKKTYECTANRFEIFIRDILSLSFGYFLPYLIIIVLNITLVLSLWQTKQRLNAKKINNKCKIFIVPILIMNLICCANSLPISISIIVVNFFSNDPVKFAKISLATVAFLYLNLMNNVCPFFVNLTFNRMFYEEFKALSNSILKRILLLNYNFSKIFSK